MFNILYIGSSSEGGITKSTSSAPRSKSAKLSSISNSDPSNTLIVQNASSHKPTVIQAIQAQAAAQLMDSYNQQNLNHSQTANTTLPPAFNQSTLYPPQIQDGVFPASEAFALSTQPVQNSSQHVSQTSQHLLQPPSQSIQNHLSSQVPPHLQHFQHLPPSTEQIPQQIPIYYMHPNQPPLPQQHVSEVLDQNNLTNSIQVLPESIQGGNSPYHPDPAKLAHFATMHQPKVPTASLPIASSSSSAVLDPKKCLEVCISRVPEYFKLSATSSGEADFYGIVFQYCKIYEPLMFAVGNIGARTANTVSDSQMAVDFKIKALNLLRQDLVNHGISESAVLCMLLLGYIELNESNFDAWGQHLDGAAKGILEILNRIPEILEKPHEHKNFITILDAMARQDILYCLFFTQRPRLHKIYSIYRENLEAPSSSKQTLATFEYHLTSLLVTASEIIGLGADLMEQFPLVSYKIPIKFPTYYSVDKAQFTPEITERCNNIWKKLNALFPMPDDGVSQIYAISVASKQAITVYFLLRLDSTEFLYEISPKLRAIGELGVRMLTRSPLNFTRFKSYTTVIWALGITADSIQTREVLMNEINRYYSHNPRTSMYALMNFLREFWKARDSEQYRDYTYRDLLYIVGEQLDFTLTF